MPIEKLLTTNLSKNSVMMLTKSKKCVWVLQKNVDDACVCRVECLPLHSLKVMHKCDGRHRGVAQSG